MAKIQGIDISLTYTGARQDIALIKISGYLDTTTSVEVSNRLKEILNKEKYQLIVDMSSVNYVSSAGWGVFVGEIRTIRENGGDLKIVQMTPDVYDVFEMLEFNRILDYYETIEESINDFDICTGLDITDPILWKNKEIAVETEKFSGPSPKVIAIRSTASADKKIKSRFSFTKPKIEESALPLVEKIKLLVIENPNDNGWKIRKKLNTDRFGFEKIGIFKITKIFKDYNLDTKEKRYRFYRSR